jgi:hypothetical protein
MAIKGVVILALAGVAFAQMNGMSGGMNNSSSTMVINTTPAADSSVVATTATSDPMDSPIDSPIGVTMPPMTTTDVASAAPTSMADGNYSSMPADNPTSDTVMVDPSMTLSTSVMTDMTDMTSMTETGSMTTIDGMPMGTGGMIMPNATATTTGKPVSGNGVVNGVSVSVKQTRAQPVSLELMRLTDRPLPCICCPDYSTADVKAAVRERHGST